MIASVGSFVSFSLIPGPMARAVPLTADAPAAQDPPQPQAAGHAADIVTLAPAAMSALLQAQEGLSQRALRPVRPRPVARFDRRASHRTDEPPVEADEGLFATRRLQIIAQARS